MILYRIINYKVEDGDVTQVGNIFEDEVTEKERDELIETLQEKKSGYHTSIIKTGGTVKVWIVKDDNTFRTLHVFRQRS